MQNPPQEIIDWAQLNISKWSVLFRPYFQPPKGRLDPSIRQRLAANNLPEDQPWESEPDPLNWRQISGAREAFEWCFCQIRSFEDQADLVSLLSPMIQLAEDYLPEARLSGTKCIHRCIKIAGKVVIRMGLADLCVEIFRVNLSMQEHEALFRETIDCFVTLMGSGLWKEPIKAPYLEVIDPFMDLVLKDLSLCRDEHRVPLLAYSIVELLKLQKLASVRFLPELMELLMDLSANMSLEESRSACKSLLCAVCEECEPLLYRHQEKLDLIRSRFV